MADPSKFIPALIFSALIGTAPALAQDTSTATDSVTTEAPAATTEAPATDAEPATPANDLALGEPIDAADGPGTTYDKEEHGDWVVRCFRTEDGNDPCQVYQLLKDANANAVAEITMFALPEGEKAAAGATIAVPLETLLTQQITLQIDGGQAKRYPFSWCSEVGCFARVGFTKEEIAAFKAGSKATVTIVPVVAPDQKVELKISLAGFTAGYDAVSKLNAE